MTFPRIKSFHWPQSPGLLSLKQFVYRAKSFTLQLWILSLDPHFHSKWEYNILISTSPDLKMSSLYTGGSGEEDERKREKKYFLQTNRGTAVITERERAASASSGCVSLGCVSLGWRPEGRPVGLSRSGQRSLTVCKSFNTCVGNNSIHAFKFAKLVVLLSITSTVGWNRAPTSTGLVNRLAACPF